MTTLLNANPTIYNVSTQNLSSDNGVFSIVDEDEIEHMTREEVFEHIRHLNDPEHPLTLEQLNVVSIDNIHVCDPGNTVVIQFTPTIPHCSMATLIGLCIRVKLLRSLPSRFKVTVEITPGAHQSETAVNKQLADKERVAAALENSHLLEVVNKCIVGTDK
jgi:metal-sulfur cluster biosynthetic enzyme